MASKKTAYHVELREFPHLTHVHNLSPQRLQDEIVGPWVRDKVFEIGEHKWIPGRTTMVILEGPEIPLHQLGLGRGWTNTVRVSTDVTARVLQAADAAADSAAKAPVQSLELELEILTRCARAPLSLRDVWGLAESAHEASAAERLALAEHAVTDLLGRGAVELSRGAAAGALDGAQAAGVLRALEEWSKDDAESVFVRAAAAPTP